MFSINLSKDDVEFIFAVLTQQPLPYVRVAPIVQSMSQQVQEQLQPPSPELDPPLANP